MDDAPDMATHTAQIYKNFLYVYGEIYENEKMKCCLWRFDISNQELRRESLDFIYREPSMGICEDSW